MQGSESQDGKEKRRRRRRQENDLYITVSMHGIIFFCRSTVKILPFSRPTANLFVLRLKEVINVNFYVKLVKNLFSISVTTCNV